MNWDDLQNEVGTSLIRYLSDDGEAVTGVVAGDPLKQVSYWMGQERVRYIVPMITTEGFCGLALGVRAIRRLCAVRDKFSSQCVRIVRHGQRGDLRTRYGVTLVEGSEQLAQQLWSQYNQQQLQQMMGDLRAVVGDGAPNR